MNRPLLALTALLAAALSAGPAAARPASYLKQPDAWFLSDEGRRVTGNVLSHQAPRGGWPKDVDTTAGQYAGDPAKLRGTFDNGATVDELRLLARAYRATGQERYRAAFLKGLDHILEAQYPGGGWPQYYPPGTGYARHVTYNDNAMVRVMELLREVAGEDGYGFVDGARRKAARESFDRGVRCILRCQVRVGGKLTAWCAQHDADDHRPRPGRSYELVSLSGAESVGIVRLLLSLEKPGPEVIEAVEAAVAWLEAAKLTGVRVVRKEDPANPRGFDRVVVPDPDAPPLWARFYEIGTDRPIFADRDGVRRYRLDRIGPERRSGYAWLGDWPARLLSRDYPAWRTRLGLPARAQP